MMTKYYKFERIFGAMKRFYEKLSIIRNGVEAYYPAPPPEPEGQDFTGYDLTSHYIRLPEPQGNDVSTLQDYIMAFFIFCHSLKDWIKNDKEIDKLIRDKVEPFITDNACLRIAADIANGEKHLERDVPSRSEIQPEWLRTETRVADDIIDGYLKRIVRSSGYISTERGETDAYVLASESMAKWEEFIKENFYKQKGESGSS